MENQTSLDEVINELPNLNTHEKQAYIDLTKAMLLKTN